MKRNFTIIGKITISLGVMIWIIILINLNITFHSQEIDNRQSDIIQKVNSPFSSNSPSINFYDIFEIDDDNIGQSIGNNDGEIDSGETIEMRMRLENQGDQDATNVNATISCTNGNITILTDFQDFLTIQNGSSGVSSSFYIFRVNSSTPASDVISFSITVNSNEGNWFDEFNITIVDNPVPTYHSYSVISENDGDLTADNDDNIDAGEIISLRIYVKNLGGANLIGLTGIINENDIYITIQDSSGDFGTIIGNGGSNYGIFGINVSGSCPDKRQIAFDLTITDSHNTKWVLHFVLIVNGSSDYELLGLVYNEYTGDGDNFFDAGEVWEITINLNNTGDANGHYIYVFLDSQDQYVEFYYSSLHRNLSCGSLGVGLNNTFFASVPVRWRFKVSDKTPRNHTLQFTIEVVDASEHETWIFFSNQTVINGSDQTVITGWEYWSGLAFWGFWVIVVIIGGLRIIIYTIRISIRSIRNWISNLSVRRHLYKGSKKEKNRLQELIQEIDEGLFNTTGKHERKNFLISLKTPLYAKVVLLGESSVGKTHLALTMTEGEYSTTQGSTVGVDKYFKNVKIPIDEYDAQICFWDLGGQWNFRSINELFLNEAAVILLVYDVTRPETFASLNYWLEMIKKTRCPAINRLFVIGNKIDVGGFAIDNQELDNFFKINNLKSNFTCSAKTGEGITSIVENIVGKIDWSEYIKNLDVKHVSLIENELKKMRKKLKLCMTSVLLSELSEKTLISDFLIIKAILRQYATQNIIQFGRSDLYTILDPSYIDKRIANLIQIASTGEGIIRKSKIMKKWSLPGEQFDLLLTYLENENICYSINKGVWVFPNVLHKKEITMDDRTREILESKPFVATYNIIGPGDLIFNRLVVSISREIMPPQFVSNSVAYWVLGSGIDQTVVVSHFIPSHTGGIIRFRAGGGKGEIRLNEFIEIASSMFNIHASKVTLK